MKICVITGTRAEYGLMRWLLQYLKEDEKINLQIIVTGMHLSNEFGLTYKSILEDGFKIDKKIEILLSSDTPVGISKSIGLATISIAEAFSELNPDLLIIFGDRFESLAAAISAMIARIPIAHVYGGESTENVIDEPIRHSITKMSYLHFTATEFYKKRVIQLGEHHSRVYFTGAPGLDNLKYLRLKNKESICNILGIKENENFFLITLHPVTFEINKAEEDINNLLSALDEFDNYKLIFTMPNADTEGRIIAYKIKEYLLKNPKKGKFFSSLGQVNYLSALKEASAVIGNSSSGIIEAPSLKTPTVNIGNRQNGRIKATSIVDCKNSKGSIVKAIQKAINNNFSKTLETTINPYEKKGASKEIYQIIKGFNFNNKTVAKKFYDL